MDRLGLKVEDEVIWPLTGLLMVSLGVDTVLFNGEVVGVGNKGGSGVDFHWELLELMLRAAGGGNL